MEETKRPFWKIVEDAIETSTGVYYSYWIQFKDRHPEMWDVPGAPPHGFVPMSARAVVEQPKVVIEPLTCKRCNHNWTPRSEKQPIQCPKCHSPYWNRERKKSGQG